MSEELKNMLAGQAEEEKSEVEPLVETDLDPAGTAKVAGGKIIETKDGKFVPVPESIPIFDSKEKAEGYETGIKDCMKKHCGHKPNLRPGILRDMPKSKCDR